MSQKKYTKIDINDITFLTNDPSWTDGVYPIDNSPEPDADIGLGVPVPAPMPSPTVVAPSKEPYAKSLSPFPDVTGPQNRPTSDAYPKTRDIPGALPTINIEKLVPENIVKGRNGKSLFESFALNTVDNWLTPPDLDSIGGYAGQFVEDGTVNNNYILEDNAFDTANQLQPSVHSTIDGNYTNLNMTWRELLSQMKLTGIDTDSNSGCIFATKVFSYQPPINIDQFVNYHYYYWTKNIGRWDTELNPNDEYGLLLINGSVSGYTDFAVGDYIRIIDTEFKVVSIDSVNNIIAVTDETDTLYMGDWAGLSQTLIGHDRPIYYTQAAGDYITTNGWIENNHWTHLDDLSTDEIEGKLDATYPKAELPIIELLSDVITDGSAYTKGAVPNVMLYPIQYVDFNQTGIPVNIEQKVVGYDTNGTPILEDRTGIIPSLAKPVLEYMTGDFHLDGNQTTIDSILGINAVKLAANSTNYIFRNGLVDIEHDDVRNDRFYIYLTQNASASETDFTEDQYVYRTVWEPLLIDEVSCDTIGNEWNIAPNFITNLEKNTPVQFERETLKNHFRLSVTDVAKNDTSLDGREYRLHPMASANRGGNILYYGQELNWYISLMLQPESSPDTILQFARSEYETRMESIRGIIYKVASDMGNAGYSITISQFRELFLQTVHNLIVGVIPNPFANSDHPLDNFIATPAHFGLALAEEPGFVFDHITQKIAYSGILGETISLPFGADTPNTLDLFYHEVMLLIYDSIPDRFKAINSGGVDFTATPDVSEVINLTDSDLIRTGVYRLPNGRLVDRLEIVDVTVNGTAYVNKEDFEVLLTKRDIAFNRYKVPTTSDVIEVTISGYSDPTIVPNPFVIQDGKQVFDIRNYVYNDPADQTLIRCYSAQDILDEEEKLFYVWLKKNVSWQDRNINPFANDQNTNDPYTWNYKDFDVVGMPAMWYEIYETYFNTSAPQIEPWIIQGYTTKPIWWDTDFPPVNDLYPYPAMWANIQSGTAQDSEITSPTPAFTLAPAPAYTLPIDTSTGELLPPYNNGLSVSMFTTIPPNRFDDFVFGDNSPTELQWRNSADYRWDIIEVGYYLKPIDFVSLSWDADRVRTWYNNLTFDTTLGKTDNHSDMIFFGEYEDYIESKIVTTTYNFISDGYTDTFGGQSYDFNAIEEYNGNGLQTDFLLEYPFETGDISLVEVNGAIVTYNVDYFFVDTTGDGIFDTIRFFNAPGSFSATTGSEWDARINDILDIAAVDTVNNIITVAGNYDNKYPDGLVASINGSTANDGLWTVANAYFDGTNTQITLTAPTATDDIVDILPTTNEFVIAGDHSADYIAGSRFFTTIPMFTGRWVIDDVVYDGRTNTTIKASTFIDLDIASVDALTNTIVINGDETLHAVSGTEIILDTTSGDDTTWTVYSSTYNSGTDQTTIALNFPVNSFVVADVDTVGGSFMIDGYQLHKYPLAWDTITITGSTGNDNTYTISNIYYNDAEQTVINVVESIPDPTVDGSLTISGTISPYNLVVGASLKTAINPVYIQAIDAVNNIFKVDGDKTADFTPGIVFEIRDSTFNSGNWTVVTSSFDGTYTSIQVIAPRNNQIITSVNTINNTVTVAGDQTGFSLIGTTADITGSTGNDGTYTITNMVFDGTNTIFSVAENLSSPVADGTLSLLSQIDGTVDGSVWIISGVLDGRLDGTVDGQIINDQNWDWDIVGWDDISIGISVPVRVRIGTPTDTMSFDANDEVNLYINGSSYANDNLTIDVNAQDVVLNTIPDAFSTLTFVVYNPHDIIENTTASSRLKLTKGLNQWYSQFYLFSGESIASDKSYSSYWKNWAPNIVYRANNIINPASAIVQGFGDLVFRNNIDYHIELDTVTGYRDFYLDSFLITVASKTETSFDTGGTAPQSTIYQIDNYDPRRNFVKTAISRKDAVYRFTLVPTDSFTLSGVDDNNATLAFRTIDDVSVIIGTTFYAFEYSIHDQTITLSQDAIDQIQVGGTEVIILVEPRTGQLVSHSSAESGVFTNVELIDNVVSETSHKGELDTTTYYTPLEFEVDENNNLATKDVILPAQFTAQELITFIAEYERYILEQGGVFDTVIDQRYRNWALMMSNFAYFVDSLEIPTGTPIDLRYINLNVMADSVKIGADFGVLSKIESEASYYSKKIQDLLDITGHVIENKNYQVQRFDGLAKLDLVGDAMTLVFYENGIPFQPSYVSSRDPRNDSTVFPTDGQIWFNKSNETFYMFSESQNGFIDANDNSSIAYTYINEPLQIYTGHFIIDKYESIIRIENDTSTGKSIYKPLTGEIIKRLYFQFEKARVYAGRPYLSGFALVPNDTTGLLEPVRNIEAQLEGLLNLYDAFNVPLDNNFINAISDLLGLEPRDYLKNFLGGASPRSMIGFQQGFIQQKGASDNIEAFVQAINSILQVTLHELWAYKVAEYGDSTGDDYVMMKITEKEGARTILGLQFTDEPGAEFVYPRLVAIKENDPARFPQLLDAYTTKDGSRFYFPSVEEGSVVPEWETNYIDVVSGEANVADITSTNEYGFDFGTFGIGGHDRVVRLAGATLTQDSSHQANIVDIQYYDEVNDVWVYLAKDVQVTHNDLYNKDYDIVVFPYHNVYARRWKLIATDVTSGTWSSTIEFHKYRAKPDYDKIGKVAGYNIKTDVAVATWFPWDVIEGYYTPEAYQYVDYDSEYDPAIYSDATIETDRKISGRAWGEEHVGEIWWDKGDWGVIDYKNVREFPEPTKRASLWGKLKSGKKVSVYEWVKSPVPPSEWSTLVDTYKNSENSLSQRIPSGFARNTTEYTLELHTNADGTQEVYYYFWVTGSEIVGYTKQGRRRTLSLDLIAKGLEHPDNIAQNKFYIIDNHLESVADWHPNKPPIPPRFTVIFLNNANEVFTSDYVDLQISRKFLLSNNLGKHDFRSDRHEEWTLIHKGMKSKPIPELWDDIVAVLTDVNAANAIDYNVDDPNRLFMPRDELLRILNKRVIEIKPDFFPQGFESPGVSGHPSFEANTPFDGAAQVVSDPNSTDPYRRIRTLGDSNINYFASNDPTFLETLMSRDSATSFYNVASIAQVNELFYDILEESLAFDTKKSNIFKTSWIAYDAIKLLVQTPTWNGSLHDLNLVLDFVQSEAKPYHTEINVDLSLVTLTYNEDMQVNLSENFDYDFNLMLNENMDVAIADDLSAIINMNLEEVIDIPIIDFLKRFNDANHNYDAIDVQIIDELSLMHVDMYPVDTIDVAFTDDVITKITMQDNRFFHDTSDYIDVQIIDEFKPLFTDLSASDAMDVQIIDAIPHITLGWYEGMDAAFTEKSLFDIHDYSFSSSENININITDKLLETVVTYVGPMYHGVQDNMDAAVDETLRIDIEEYDATKNWYYSFYMIHDGGQNQSATTGSTFGDGDIIGLQPGIDEDPSSEDWYRWDGVLLDDVYYVSSYDNFAFYDTDLIGYDLDYIGRAGYNWDGVGNNTINSTSISGLFLRARPEKSGLPAGEYQFTYEVTTATSVWIVSHQLGYIPIVRTYLSTGEEIIPESVVTTKYTTVITFSTAQTGIAKIV